MLMSLCMLVAISTSVGSKDWSTCNVVQAVDMPGVASAFVRSEQNTKDGPPLSLDPACSSCADSDASSEDAATCGTPPGSLRVPFNSRSYLLSEYDVGSCAAFPFQKHRYDCVDYAKGALFLSGKKLEFDVDLSGVGCGCNAAVYLVSMPQTTNKSACFDYYCDANDVVGALLACFPPIRSRDSR